MSCAAFSAATKITDPLTLPERSVLLTLADYANDAGQCWPSQDRLALESRVTRRTVQAVLPKLQAYGFLATATPRRGRSVTVYQLELAALTAAAERCKASTATVLLHVQRRRGYGERAAPQPIRYGEPDAPQTDSSACAKLPDPIGYGERAAPQAPTVMAQQTQVYGEPAAPDPFDPRSKERRAAAQTPPCGKLHEPKPKTPAPVAKPPYKLYVSAGHAAVDRALRRDRDNSYANVKEHLKQVCAERGLPYDSVIVGKLLEDVLYRQGLRDEQRLERLAATG